MNKMDEMIIVAPRTKVFENESLAFQGTIHDTSILNILQNIASSYQVMRRGAAEENENFKQPIPYAVIKRGNEIFVYERLKGAGETRLHNKLSLGVGGHMNPVEDPSFSHLLIDNLKREIKEELIISGEEITELEIIGIINDDSDDVGKVHIGILVILNINEGTQVEVRETEELAGEFIPLEKLKDKETYERLENWSKIVVDIL
ncbi:hypothetical protein [Bacillus wiedmannii]|uniref:hypothetical protein n=1 Tax=Bacillus wiedmannii TaxID=1890302 RepID=UPI000BEF5B31|nr:hypothetical protein [Bacillus wiedmannii]PEN61580.1 hypothetical protein CN576_21325 [Bacillus wiedmannii]